VLLMLAGLCWWFRPTLGRIALAVANRSLPGLFLEAASVQRFADHLEIKKLRVSTRAENQEILIIDHLDVFAGWGDLRNRRIREIRCSSPVVHVTQEGIDALLS